MRAVVANPNAQHTIRGHASCAVSTRPIVMESRDAPLGTNVIGQFTLERFDGMKQLHLDQAVITAPGACVEFEREVAREPQQIA